MAIPEFILRKLIVPGSLHAKNQGFEFVLLNTFAPATITAFSLKVGSIDVSPSSIRITPAGGQPFYADLVSRENPLVTTVGIEIHIEIENQSMSGPIQICADTKEVGTIEFSLSDSLKKPRYHSFKSSWTSLFRPSLNAKINLNTQDVLGQVSPFILGQFVEHLERCVYDGIWTKDGSSLRQDTLALLHALHPPMIRYPGGNFASGYHWEDGIGPKEKRPTRHDQAWQAEDTNQVGTDEFLSLCEELDTEPYLVVNDGSGTPEEAARWVAYCNSPEDSEQGRRRTNNGHPSPYNVKYWGVGNEVWGPWQIGTTSAAEYAERLMRFSKAMKAVDPTIKIIAVGNNPLSDDPEDLAACWNREVLDKASDSFDYLSWHIYQPEQDSWKESYDSNELFAAVCAAPLDFEKIITRVHQQIQESQGKNRITQCIDEWNIWLPPGKKAKSMHQVTYTLRDCLYVGGVINSIIRNFDKVDIAALAQLVNVLPLIQTDEKTAFATAIYYPFVLASMMEDWVIPSLVDSPTFNSNKIGENVQAHSDVPYLDAAATQSLDGKSLTLLLLNRHPENRMNVTLNFSEHPSFSQMDLQEIKGYTPDVFNNFVHSNSVHIHQLPSKQVNGSSVQITLSPSSVTFCRFS